MTQLVARPRRSILYVPAINARALEKATGLAADGLILDLEDSVAPDKKEEALAVLTDALSRHDYSPREVSVRVSGLGSPTLMAELSALAKLPIDVINFPKIDSAEQVLKAVELANAAGCQQPLSLMIESPVAILSLEAIVTASDRVTGLVMGTSDLVKDMNALHMPMRENLQYALSKAVLAAKAADMFVIDGVHLDLADVEGYDALCDQGRAMGFDGKSVIHPKQIGGANRAFAPSDAEIDYAERVITAHKAAVDAGKGVVLVDGKLVENLHVELAGRLLASAARIRDMEDSLSQ